jgi:hypothetical protein
MTVTKLVFVNNNENNTGTKRSAIKELISKFEKLDRLSEKLNDKSLNSIKNQKDSTNAEKKNQDKTVTLFSSNRTYSNNHVKKTSLLPSSSQTQTTQQSDFRPNNDIQFNSCENQNVNSRIELTLINHAQIDNDQKKNSLVRIGPNHVPAIRRTVSDYKNVSSQNIKSKEKNYMKF